MATGKPILDHQINIRTSKPFGQFGQIADVSTFGGITACGHTSIQHVLLTYGKGWHTQDEISKIAGYPWPASNPNRRGLSQSMVERVMAHFGIKYTTKLGLSSSQLLQASALGPVFVVVRYGNYPNWRNYKGVARPKPFARPYEHAGRNQFSGFFGSHWVVEMGYTRVVANGVFVRNDVYVMEPNHDSPARPENVAYDVVTQTDFVRAFTAIKQELGWSTTLAVVPLTRAPA